MVKSDYRLSLDPVCVVLKIPVQFSKPLMR